MGCGGSRQSAHDRRHSRDRRSYDHSSRSSQRQRHPTSRSNERARPSSLRQPHKECCCNTVNFSAYQYPEQTCQCQQQISDVLSQTSNASEMPTSTSNCCCSGNQSNLDNESPCDCDDAVQRGGEAGCKTVVCLTFNPPQRQ